MKEKGVKRAAWYAVVILASLLFLFTLCRLVMMLALPSRLPSFFGYSHAIVLSGSMEPTLSAGDLVICKSQDSYEINDVIAYYDATDGVFVLHRIVREGADGFITQGDFNPESDPFPVPEDAIQGKVILSVPNMKTVRDLMLGALLALLTEHAIRAIATTIKERSKEGGRGADEEA